MIDDFFTKFATPRWIWKVEFQSAFAGERQLSIDDGSCQVNCTIVPLPKVCQKRIHVKKCYFSEQPSTHHSMQMRAINRRELFYNVGLESSLEGWCSFKSLWIPKSTCHLKYKRRHSEIYCCIERRLDDGNRKLSNIDLTVKMGRKEWWLQFWKSSWNIHD